MNATFSWLKRIHNQAAVIVSFLVGAGVALWGIRRTAEDAARSAVLEPSFIREVSAQFRPFFVIDSLGSIRSDHGGSVLIDRTSFNVSTNLGQLDMIIGFNSHHESPPIVRPMTGHLYVHSVNRGVGHSWEVHLRASQIAFDEGGFGMVQVALDPPHSFLVEVLP